MSNSREMNWESLGLSRYDKLGCLLLLLGFNFLPTTGFKLAKQQLIPAYDILELLAWWRSLCRHALQELHSSIPMLLFDYKESSPSQQTYTPVPGPQPPLPGISDPCEIREELECLPA